jgi:glycosyltransferase involved in cell wall biosynthesis
MVHVVFDYQTFLFQRYGGISRYFYELVQSLRVIDGVRADIVAPLYASLFMTRNVRPMSPAVRVPRARVINRLSTVTNELLSTIMLPLVQPDVIHETFYYGPLSHRLATPRVTTVHDMIPEKLATSETSAPFRQLKRRAVERASHVCCVSETTRRDLIELSGVCEDRVTVTHLAPSETFRPTNAPRYVADEYILFVGGRGGYKNAMTLLKAYCRDTWLHQNLSLVFFGAEPLTPAELAVAQHHRVPPERLLHLQGGDDTLCNLYTYARAFVYPSMYEGFGITLLEAMRCGCPVVASTGGALSEIAGEAAELFAPQDTEELAAKLRWVVEDSQRAQQLRVLGSARAQRFRWERCARATLAVYAHVAEDAPGPIGALAGSR